MSIPYNDTIEDLIKHAARVIRELHTERNWPSSASYVASIDRDLAAVTAALEVLNTKKGA
jgi:hypothetical protein